MIHLQKWLLTFCLLFTFSAFVPINKHKAAYTIFNKEGKPANYTELATTAAEAHVVFFGELHNNPIAHWLQLELTEDIYAIKDSMLSLGAEMFEADNQLLIDEYLQGTISQKSFEKEVRLWPNYATDYKPLLTFAKEKDLPFIATNVPRRYAAMVNHQGTEALFQLSASAKQYLPPLPYAYDSTLSCYAKMAQIMRHCQMDKNHLAEAQALKDATMAWFIAQNMKENGLFLHFNGAYHSQNKEGIVWYLQSAKAHAKILTISTVEQSQLDSLSTEHYGSADYIIVVDNNMTKTY